MDRELRRFFVRQGCLRAARDAYVFAAIVVLSGASWLDRHRLY